MKSVVITGSTRGLGLCLAKEFLRAGCNVTVSGRTEEPLRAAEKELETDRGRTLFVLCDVAKKADVENLWSESAKVWGQVDIWINNAGRSAPHEFVYDTDSSYVDAVVDTNLKGMVYGSQVAAKNMLLQKQGQIWNMEGLGSNDMIQVRTILYGSTKRALTYFTMGLAKELEGTGVLAGRLSPGMMLTDFILKSPDGEKSPALDQKRFQNVFNILGDRPETVAEFFVPKILANRKNNAHIVWLTGAKAGVRFALSPFGKRELI